MAWEIRKEYWKDIYVSAEIKSKMIYYFLSNNMIKSCSNTRCPYLRVNKNRQGGIQHENLPFQITPNPMDITWVYKLQQVNPWIGIYPCNSTNQLRIHHFILDKNKK